MGKIGSSKWDSAWGKVRDMRTREEESTGMYGGQITGRWLRDGKTEQWCRKWVLYVGLVEVPKVNVGLRSSDGKANDRICPALLKLKDQDQNRSHSSAKEYCLFCIMTLFYSYDHPNQSKIPSLHSDYCLSKLIFSSFHQPFYLGILVQENWKSIFSWIKNVPSALLKEWRFSFEITPLEDIGNSKAAFCWWLQGGWTVISVSRVGWCVARSCLPHWCFGTPVTGRLLYWHLKSSFFHHVVFLLLSLFMSTACVRFTPN